MSQCTPYVKLRHPPRGRRPALGLLVEARERASVSHGYRWRFESSPDLLVRIARTIDAELQCCRFLRFVLTVEPAGSSVWLEVTGPAGAVKFLDTLSEA